MKNNSKARRAERKASAQIRQAEWDAATPVERRDRVRRSLERLHGVDHIDNDSPYFSNERLANKLGDLVLK